MQQPPPWTGWKLVGQVFSLSASVAALLRGGWMEMLCGGLIQAAFCCRLHSPQQILRPWPRHSGHPRLCRLTGTGLGCHFPEQSPFISAVAGVVLYCRDSC